MTEKAEKYLSQFTKSGKKVEDLSRFKALCGKFGDPQDSLRFVHVAGTNGKGSVTRMVGEMCMNAGAKTGEFTSPYIHVYNDRIRINNENIPDDKLDSLIDVVAAAITPENGYSQFEISNIIALLYFKQENVDIVILETGLGGLLDSTNIIKSNICAVITSISLDHTAVLGNTVEEIAAQKAGIIKSGCPVIVSPQNSESVINVIKEHAEKLGSKVIVPDLNAVENQFYEDCHCGFVYRKLGFTVGSPGRYQLDNALCAIEAGFIVAEQLPQMRDYDIVMGVGHAHLPSRLQLTKGSPDILTDGAHNPDAMKKLSEHIKELDYKKIVMICGMSGTKDYDTALRYIAPLVDEAYCIDDFTFNTVKAETLASYFANAHVCTTADALERAKACAGKDGLVLIAGSLLMGL